MSAQIAGMVAVDGATGYLGSHLVARLRQMGVAVRSLVHKQAKESDVQFLKSLGSEVVAVDLLNPAEAQSALSGVAVVVHLIGSVAPRKGEKLETLHRDQTAGLAKAAVSQSVEKVVMVTALGTGANAVSEYHRTKWLAEEALKHSGIRFTILRPSLIIGKQVGQRNSKLVARYQHLIKTRPSVPLLNGGHNKLQPVFIGDLVEAIIVAIKSDSTDGGTFEIGGPEVVTMRDLVSRLMAAQGADKKIVALPGSIANVVATVCEAFQPVPTLSKDQVKMSTQDMICKDNALTRVFAVQGTPISTALQTYHQANQESSRVGIH